MRERKASRGCVRKSVGVVNIGCRTQLKPSADDQGMTPARLGNGSLRLTRLVRLCCHLSSVALGLAKALERLDSEAVRRKRPWRKRYLDLARSFLFYSVWAREEPGSRSNDPVGVSKRPDWCVDATLRSRPALPGFRTENGLGCLRDWPCDAASQLTLPEGFRERSPALEHALDSVRAWLFRETSELPARL